MDKDSSSRPTHPDPASGARDVFAAWVPSPKERNDMIDVAAYHIAQRSGFNCDPNECWNAGAAQVDLMLSLRENQLKLQILLDNSLDAKVTITERMPQQDSLEQQVRERTAQLRAMAVELTMAEERERHVVAQELHDTLGQTLAVAKLKLSALDLPQPDSPASSQLKREVKEIESLLDEANHAMRSLSQQLSPPVLHELGLVPALEWLADEMQRSFGLRINVRDDRLPKPLDEIGLKAVFRATRELLINVAKHAQVSMAEVEATREEDHLVLSVADSGVGFDESKDSAPSTQHGYGLFSVRERIDFMGGKVQIDSSPGNGTVVVMTMPLAASRPA